MYFLFSSSETNFNIRGTFSFLCLCLLLFGTRPLQNKIALQVLNDQKASHVTLCRIDSAASKADKLINVSGLWSSVHSSLTLTFTCAALQLISGVFTLKNTSVVCVSDHESTHVGVFAQIFFLCFCRSSLVALGGNRLVNQWIKPTDHQQEIPADRRSYWELLSCLKEKWNNRLL